MQEESESALEHGARPGEPTVDSGAAPEFAWTVTEETSGRRLDVVVAELLPEASRAEAQRLIAAEADGGVLVNGRREKASYRVRAGERIVVTRPALSAATAAPEELPLRVVYEDEDLLVIDKARGMVVHPAPGSPHGTVVNAVLAYSDDLSGIGGVLRPGIVHRLDKDTGGLLLIAKNDPAHRALQAQISERSAERRYLAVVWGAMRSAQTIVDAPIGRHPRDRKKMAIVTDPRYASRTARTELIVREAFGTTFTLLEARLETGRTHQIRVHCAYVQHPVVGDPLYGGLRSVPAGFRSAARRAEIEQAIRALDGQALHAFSLSFTQPRTGERLSFRVELPAVMRALVDLLRAD
jgi:23S rRNA pseudouridine1911/1915/1917 synthase